MIVELLLVRHGFSCANAWKRKIKGIHLLYADPELTKEGKHLCEDRKEDMRSAIDKCFHEHPYIVATSSMIRTQQTAFHMLLKGTDLSYTIFPHVAEEGVTSNNFPMPADRQAPILGPSVLHHLGKDLRGSTNLENKSNWPKFLKWLEGPQAKEGSTEGPHRIVLFTHGKFIRNALKIPTSEKPQNNDIFYVKVDTGTGTFLEKKRLTHFPQPPVSVEGCRIEKTSAFVTKLLTRRKRRRTYKRK